MKEIIITAAICAPVFAAIGFVLAAIMITGRQSDPREPEDREYSLAMEDKIVAIEDKPTKPARIFTNGCLVKWGNTVHEIDFMEERNGQVHRVPPSDIKFTDRKICNYVFEEVSEENE